MIATELVDAVDAHDQVIGVVPRIALQDASWNYRVVHLLLLDDEGRLALQRPAPGKAHEFDLGSSVAGHVQHGESYAAAIRRECIEELGGCPDTIEEIGRTWIDDGTRRKFIGVFVGRVDFPLRLDPTEVMGIEFAEPAKIREWLRKGEPRFSRTFERVFRFAQAHGRNLR